MKKTTELAYWINERYRMKTRRDNGEPPKYKYGWSDDIYMGTVRYCNVHREDDKVTRWLADNWRTDFHAVWQIVLARMVNYIPSLSAILTQWNADPDNEAGPIWVAENVLKETREQGFKIFTSAYTISTCGQAMDKVDYVIGVVKTVQGVFGDSPNACLNPMTLESSHAQLTCIPGLGSFLAAQVIADLKNTDGHPLTSAPDWWDWCAPGPGSLKGLNAYFYGSDQHRGVTERNFHEKIRECYNDVLPLIQDVPRMHMQDFQNCLCEFSKYERVKRGGHVRNKYHPG